MYHKTGGCFDLTMSALMALWLDEGKQLKTLLKQKLRQ